MTLVEMLESMARDRPERTAMVSQDATITYGELNAQVNQLAHALLALGCRAGDRVALMLPRSPELVIGFLAAVKVQGIATPLNFELPVKEMSGILDNLRPRVLIVQANYRALAAGAIPAGLDAAVIRVGGEAGPGFIAWEELVRHQSRENPGLEVRGADVAYLNYTSGSTGRARGAVTTHDHIYWNTRSAVETLGLTEGDVHLCLFAPFAHPHELFVRPLYLGGTMVLLDSIRPKTVAKAIRQHGVTCFMALVPMYRTMLESAASEQFDLSSLRLPESGGMHTPVELVRQFEQTFGAPIYAVWGSTETTGIAIANRPGVALRLDSVGQPCKYYDVKVVGEDGRELGAGEIGELIFRGPGVVETYYEEQEENNFKSFRHGWYYSGDLGRRDEDGNFFFVERKSGMLKVAGHQVYPLEIELKLLRHPAILEAAVIGVPDKMRGEAPKAIVVLKNGAPLDRRELMRYCSEEMASYKVPREIEFREALPKIGSGKINKKALMV